MENTLKKKMDTIFINLNGLIYSHVTCINTEQFMLDNEKKKNLANRKVHLQKKEVRVCIYITWKSH